MAKHLVSASASSITLEVVEPSGKDVTYAAYLYDASGLCIIKRWYQASGRFTFDDLPKGAYKARIFSKSSATKQTSSWNTERMQVLQPMKDDDAQSIVAAISRGIDAKTNILCLFERYPAYLHQALHSLRIASQGSRVAHDAAAEIAAAIFDITQERNLVPAQVAFALNLIALLAPPEFLKDNEAAISAYAISAKDIPDSEKNFSMGLIQYRIGNFCSAERAFQAINAEDPVRYHQSGARSYLYSWEPSDSTKYSGQPIQVVRLATAETNGVVLVSCDYGYFKSYFDRTREKLADINCALHVHVMLPDGVNVHELEGIPPWGNLGISYELESPESRERKNRRTYYAVARYLICGHVLDLYKKPVLVADIDIDFDRSIDCAFDSIGDDEIALYFGKLDLPWLKIMAGFNLFGKDAKNSEFLTYLQDYMWHCLSTGKDGWTMDQVALDAAYKHASYKQKSRIRPIVDLLGFSPKQYSNRQASRTNATRSVTAAASPEFSTAQPQ